MSPHRNPAMVALNASASQAARDRGVTAGDWRSRGLRTKTIQAPDLGRSNPGCGGLFWSLTEDDERNCRHRRNTPIEMPADLGRPVQDVSSCLLHGVVQRPRDNVSLSRSLEYNHSGHLLG